MLTLLTAAAILAGSPAENGHSDFRLPANIAARGDGRCPSAPGVTVCASRAESHLRWRAVGDDGVAPLSASQHLRALRLQPTRCTNPVEDGLRCIKPLAFARINLDD